MLSKFYSTYIYRKLYQILNIYCIFLVHVGLFRCCELKEVYKYNMQPLMKLGGGGRKRVKPVLGSTYHYLPT